MVLLQKWPFFQNVFYDILERKTAFLGYKNKKFKMSKNWHFSKGVNPWFWSKNCHFSNFFLSGNIVQEKVFYDILEKKNGFLGYKNKKFKKSKDGQGVNKKVTFFQQGLTHGFGPKMTIFRIFFLRQYSPGKCLLWYSRTKKRLSRL